jgi:hypothetical protein
VGQAPSARIQQSRQLINDATAGVAEREEERQGLKRLSLQNHAGSFDSN